MWAEDRLMWAAYRKYRLMKDENRPMWAEDRLMWAEDRLT